MRAFELTNGERRPPSKNEVHEKNLSQRELSRRSEEKARIRLQRGGLMLCCSVTINSEISTVEQILKNIIVNARQSDGCLEGEPQTRTCFFNF